MRPTHDQQVAADTAALDALAARVKVVNPRPACASCNAFIPGQLNPSAGIGDCLRGHTAVFPNQQRHCADFRAR